MRTPRFVPYTAHRAFGDAEIEQRAQDFYAELRRRRTVRDFSDRPGPRAIIEHALLTAGTAPNGANLQPWHFVAVSDAGVKATHPRGGRGRGAGVQVERILGARARGQ